MGAFSCLGTVDGEASVKVEGGGDHALTPDGDGYYSGQVAQIGQDARYQFDVNAHLQPDPASRGQPKGPLGPSLVLDPARCRWRRPRTRLGAALV
ncbi:MAG: hypothetical protein ACJ8H8_34510 [Geminicoccaceae bacterium]